MFALSHSKRKPELKSSSYSDLEMMLQNIYKLLNFFNRYVFQNYDDDNDDYDDELFVVWLADEKRLAFHC